MTDPAAHTPDVDTLVEKLTIALTWVPWDRRREADAALSDLAATARERDEVAEDARVVRAERLLIFEKLQAAEADRDELTENLRLSREAHWADRDRLARRAAELEAALRDLLDNIGGHEHWDSTRQWGAGCPTCIQQREAKERARAALAGDGGGPRYGCAPGCRADMDAGLHKPECRVPPAGDGGGA